MEMDIKDIKEMQRHKLVKRQNIRRMPSDRIWPILKFQEDMHVDEVGGMEFGIGEAYIFCKRIDDIFVYKFTDEGIKKHVNRLKALYFDSQIKRRRNGRTTIV